jgi:predicted nucleotidyltransferase
VECFRGKAVRIFRVDRSRVLATLRERAQRAVAEHPELLEVWLFGSLARGGGQPGSDADLVLKVSRATERFLDRSDAYRACFERIGLACDLLVYTSDEWERLGREGRRFPRVVDREGTLLARHPDAG